ncbi:MAG: DNA-deoxyinosine glycosylase [Nevskiales bacterium]|nr:DNA-deoxyinosine glycosylase [Nevskiales bacterium]
MSRISSFPPLIAREARLLILGSMPSAASLRARQYYAHPQNAFWWIMGELFGAGPELPYARRTIRLARHGIAVWDVLKCCERPGSLDTDIRTASEVPNDIPGLLVRQPQIQAVFLNGSKAADAFRRHVQTRVYSVQPDLVIVRLPSTSPANARCSRVQKLRAWSRLLDTVRRSDK